MSAACAPAAIPNITAARKNLRIATLRSNTLDLWRSSLVNLNQSLRGVANSSFRDAPLGAGPESITPVAMFWRGGRWLNHDCRGYGFSDAQWRIIARATRAPE